MIWHIVLLDATQSSVEERVALKGAIQALVDIDEVLWIRDGSEPENRTIGFLSIFQDAASLDAYRDAPLHLELARLIKSSGAVVHRLDFEGPPPPI